MNWIQKFAKKVNDHGNSPTYKDGFDKWRSDMTSTSRIFITEEALKAYKQFIGQEVYDKKYGTSFKDILNNSSQAKLDALRYYYDNILNSSMRNGYEKAARRTNSENAAAASAAGAAVSLIPHPVAKVVGGVMSTSDLIYDTADLVTNPSTETVQHEAADIAEPVGNGLYTFVRTTPNKFDDILPIVLKGWSIYDDLSQQSTDKKKQGGSFNYLSYLKSGGDIHIKPENRGKFTEYCGGKVTDECIQRAKRSGNKKLIKRAVFAQNSRKWKH